MASRKNYRLYNVEKNGNNDFFLTNNKNRVVLAENNLIPSDKPTWLHYIDNFLGVNVPIYTKKVLFVGQRVFSYNMQMDGKTNIPGFDYTKDASKITSIKKLEDEKVEEVLEEYESVQKANQVIVSSISQLYQQRFEEIKEEYEEKIRRIEAKKQEAIGQRIKHLRLEDFF